MTAWRQIHGHLVWWDELVQMYRYADDNSPASNVGATKTYDRPCPRCGEMPTPEGYDACTGYVEGIDAFCCGHGFNLDGAIRKYKGEK